jgi:antitoxin component YwqK of YwqJK toxin-antitoxin module
MTDYYPSGALKGERYFVNDKQEGKTTLFYENGEIKEVQYYKEGLRNGGDTLF